MDARSLVILLTLFLGTAISLKRAQASTDGCSVIPQPAPIKVKLNDTTAGIFCDSTQWMIGSDRCDLGSFTEYSRCSGNSICYVSASDYLVKGPTFVCCYERQQPRECHEIIITPTTTHQVPPIVIAGRTETVHTIITSKPRPAETDPGVIVNLLTENVNITSLNVSTVLVSDPTDVTKYVAIHTFNVPLDIGDKMGVTIRFEFTQPFNWNHLDNLVPPVIPVVTVPGADPPTQPTDNMTEPSTEGEEDTSATSACLGREMIVAAVVGAAVCTAMLMAMAIAMFFICRVCLKKVKKSENQYGDSSTAVPSAPNKLPLPPISSPGSNSTMTTPAFTPTPMGDSATCRLLTWPTGGTGAAVTDPANGTVATNPAFQRQQSRDSSSTTTTTTPTDADKLLPVPAPVAVSASSLTGSTGLGSSMGTTSSSGGSVVHVVTSAGSGVALETGQYYTGYPSNNRTGNGGGDRGSVERREPSSNIIGSTQLGSSSDPRYHTYATLGEFQPSGSASTGTAGGQSHTTGVGGGSSGSILTRTYYNEGQLPQLSLQLNHQTRQSYEMCNSNSSVPVPSLSTAHPSSMGTSSLISPPPPAADPNYSTGGRNMHLLPQYSEQANATNV